MSVRVCQPDESQLQHHAWREQRRRVCPHDLSEQIPPALRWIDLQLKLRRSLEVQTNAGKPGKQKQRHYALQCTNASQARPGYVPCRNRQREHEQRQRDDLCAVLEVRQQQEIDERADHPDDEHGENQLPEPRERIHLRQCKPVPLSLLRTTATRTTEALRMLG